MRLTNSLERYGAVAILLHWGMAAVLVVLLAMGLYMVSLPDAGYDQEKITLILVHKALGMAALAALVVRFAWRMVNVLPRLADGLPQWQQVAARFVHLAFYALLFALPVTGWLMSSAGGYPVPLPFDVNLPDLVAVNEAHFHFYIALHRWLGYALLVLLVLHAAAALRHHFVARDETLVKMWP